MAYAHGTEELYPAFEHVPPPRSIPHHREGCCGSDEYYENLVRKPRGSLDADDFAMYLPHVLNEGNGTAEDFTYLLPRLLELWVLYMPGGSVVDDWLFEKLLRDGFIHRRISPDLREACVRFIDKNLLALLDDVPSIGCAHDTSGPDARPRWPAIWFTRGMLGPIGKVWDDWWSLRTLGRARAAVQFASCLVVLPESNPLFLPWTREGGGGPPGLTEDLSMGLGSGWLPENVDEFRRRLSVDTLAALLTRCEDSIPAPAERAMITLLKERLAGVPEIAVSRLYELEEAITRPLTWERHPRRRP